MIARLAAAARQARPWPRAGIAVALGALTALAFAPIHAVPVLFVAFPGLLWLLDGCTGAKRPRLSAFALGWCFGLGHFVPGLYWIALSLLTDPERFAWLVPFCVLGVPAGLAVFPAAAILLLHMSGARGAGRVLLFAGLWTLAEWLRGHVLTGFPWNLAAYTWSRWPEMIQLASVIGAYGLSLVTVAVAAAPALLTDARLRLRAAGATAAVLVALFAFGTVRLAGPGESAVENVRLRLVQAHVAQSLKWRDEQRREILRSHLELSRSPGWERATHVIWPETAVPYVLSADANARAAVALAAPPGGALITGGLRVTEPAAPFHVWNSLYAVTDDGTILSTYDKAHLVPFGEYVPLRRFLPIDKITPGTADLSAGPGPRTIALPGLPPFSPLICYEAIFPHDVVGVERPAWLLNITNDAWFGKSTGPHQHFAAARVRAVEEGLPLVRAANTGISAVVDAKGRIVALLDLGARGVLDADLPGALDPTLYARFGDGGFALLLTLALASGWRARRPGGEPR